MEIKELYTTYKPLLFSLAYRMLGTVMDAEDMVQETFLTISKMQMESITNIKAYLCKILTNRCVDYLKSARKQREVYVGPWLPEPLILSEEENGPLESAINHDYLSIAYLTLMEKLTSVERAVFILREVLDFDYHEIAGIIDKNDANCRKIFSRVKQKLGNSIPDEPRSFGYNQKLLYDFITGIHTGNKDALLELVSENVTLYSDGGGKVLAAIHPIVSRDRVLPFLFGISKKVPDQFHSRIVNINGTPGILNFVAAQPHSTISYMIRDNRIEEIYIIVNPEKLKHITIDTI